MKRKTIILFFFFIIHGWEWGNLIIGCLHKKLYQSIYIYIGKDERNSN